MMGGVFLFFCARWVCNSIFLFLKVDFEYNGVIWSDRQATRAMCWENPKDLPACDVSEWKRSDR